MKFAKYHALGNDYLVLNQQEAMKKPTKRSVRLICHRNFGLGSDGILYGPLPSDKADFGLRILNPDGSEAEKSGNGLRIFARYLWDIGKVKERPFSVETPGGIVSCEVSRNAEKISVEMGQISFNSEKIPVAGEARQVLDEEIEVGAATFRIYCASIGNPHCVIPLPEISEQLAKQFGPEVETHELFPNAINVQFMKVLNRSTIQIEIWERGAGYTLASGSSSCAAAAVAYHLKLVGPNINVKMPGGTIKVQIAPDYTVYMTGPATRVGDYRMSDDVLKQSVRI